MSKQLSAATPVTTAREGLYEGMFVMHSGRFSNDPERATQSLMDILEKAGATIVAHRPWQDGKLAYPIERQRKGLHYLVYFRMTGERMPEVDRGCRLSDVILRNIIISHPQKLFDALVAALKGETSASTPEGTTS